MPINLCLSSREFIVSIGIGHKKRVLGSSPSIGHRKGDPRFESCMDYTKRVLGSSPVKII